MAENDWGQGNYGANAMQARDGNGNHPNQEDCDGTPDFSASEALTAEELDGLNFMREEEKLARDVYITLYAEHNNRIFNNISRSEQRHMNAIKVILDKYEITDPIINDEIGVFVNSDLQALYNQLIEQGAASLISGLSVGAAIEEIDILDLMEEIENASEYDDVLLVYNNLKRGSGFHLRAFTGVLSRQGVAYEPQYMDIDLYNSIVNP